MSISLYLVVPEKVRARVLKVDFRKMALEFLIF